MIEDSLLCFFYCRQYCPTFQIVKIGSLAKDQVTFNVFLVLLIQVVAAVEGQHFKAFFFEIY